MRKEYSLAILTPKSLFAPIDYISVVRQQCELLPHYQPTRWDFFEPIRMVFDLNELEKLINKSGKGDTAFWKKTGKPRVNGYWSVRHKLRESADASASVKIEFYDKICENEVLNYMKLAAMSLNADFGFIDTLNHNHPEYITHLQNSEAVPWGDRFILTSHELRNWLPDMFWATVFGPPYVRMFGKEKLMNTPAYRVESLGPEMVYIQLTESIDDVHDHFYIVQDAREAAKVHLGKESFFDLDRAYDWRRHPELTGKAFRVPEFCPLPD